MDELDNNTPLWVMRGHLLLARRRLIVIVTAVALVIGLLIAFTMPKRYTASARIMPPEQGGSGLMLAALLGRASSGLGALGPLAGGLFGAHSTTALYIELLHSGAVTGPIIDRYDLQHYYHKRYRMDTAKTLIKRTTITEDKKSGVLSIAVWDTDKARARDLAQAYLDQLNVVVNRTSTSSAHQERLFIERRLAGVKTDLEHAQVALSEFSSKNSTIDIKEQTRAMVDAGARVQGELLVEQAGLQSMRQIYGDDNVRVRSTEARIASLRGELTKMTGTAPTPGAETEAPAAPLKDELYPPLRKLPGLAVPYADLYREVRVQETVFELLTQQYELARIEEAKDTPVVNVIDAPGVPEKKSFPPRLLLAIAFTAFAFACCCTLILLWEAWLRVPANDPRKALLLESLRTLPLPKPSPKLAAMTGEVTP